MFYFFGIILVYKELIIYLMNFSVIYHFIVCVSEALCTPVSEEWPVFPQSHIETFDSGSMFGLKVLIFSHQGQFRPGNADLPLHLPQVTRYC